MYESIDQTAGPCSLVGLLSQDKNINCSLFEVNDHIYLYIYIYTYALFYVAHCKHECNGAVNNAFLYIAQTVLLDRSIYPLAHMLRHLRRQLTLLKWRLKKQQQQLKKQKRDSRQHKARLSRLENQEVQDWLWMHSYVTQLRGNVDKSARTNQHIQYHCDESASANVGAAAAVPYFAHAATIAGEPSWLKASLFRTVFNIVICYVCSFGLEFERVVF